MALAKEDLIQIRDIVTEVVDKKIDNFAIAVAKGFEQVDRRFDQVDKRFDRLEASHDGLRQEFNASRSETRENFSRLWDEIISINRRLDQLDKRSDQDTILALKEIERIKKRVSYLEKQLKIKTA